MEKNLLKTMERLEIDENVRGLVRQLWKHGYKTQYSCEGKLEPKSARITDLLKKIIKNDDSPYSKDSSYVTVSNGDGWFEENALKYGLRPVKETRPIINPALRDSTCYRGRLIPNHYLN